MTNLDNVRKAYESLYRKLKAKTVEAMDRATLPVSVKEEIAEYISNLPHPRLASVWDIRDICMTCVSGPLEHLYDLFGNDARTILSEIQKQELMEIPPPPTPARYSFEDIATMLAWTNEVQLHQLSFLQAVKATTDITLKARCPHCASDLMIVITKGRDLHLRCRNRKCNKEWFVRDVTPSP